MLNFQFYFILMIQKLFLLDAPKELAVVIGKEAWENQGGYAGNYFLKFPKNCFTIVAIRHIVAIVSICLEEEEKTMIVIGGHAQTTWTLWGEGGWPNVHVCFCRGEGGWDHVYMVVFPYNFTR